MKIKGFHEKIQMRNIIFFNRVIICCMALLYGESVLSMESAKRGPDYENDVAPIIYKHCTACHVDGGIAPFSLEGYENVSRFIEFGINRIEQNLMPPGIVHSDFDVEGSEPVPENELHTLREWVKTGKPRGAVSHIIKKANTKARIVGIHFLGVIRILSLNKIKSCTSAPREPMSIAI